jgi:hypothetical protein
MIADAGQKPSLGKAFLDVAFRKIVDIFLRATTRLYLMSCQFAISRPTTPGHCVFDPAINSGSLRQPVPSEPVIPDKL